MHQFTGFKTGDLIKYIDQSKNAPLFLMVNEDQEPSSPWISATILVNTDRQALPEMQQGRIQLWHIDDFIITSWEDTIPHLQDLRLHPDTN